MGVHVHVDSFFFLITLLYLLHLIVASETEFSHPFILDSSNMAM
jgi:hypothetical protein